MMISRADTAAVAAGDAADAEARERRRVERSMSKPCESYEDLTPARQQRVAWPWRPAFLVTLRGSAATRSIDYFDSSSGNVTNETVYPWSASLGAGMFVSSRMLIGATLAYRSDALADDTSLVCQNGTGGKTPPAFTCHPFGAAAPQQLTTTSVRVELRHFFYKALAWNPAFVAAWQGQDTGLFSSSAGMWRIDVPVYLQLSTDPLNAFAVGLAFTHTQTFNAPFSDTYSDDGSVFLSAGFDLGHLGK
jgi:hypothetical protein